ncbi:hypothetical protein L1987_19231 [Smallanthus sonchifolius]|uniref:Uncharacterized protein n=1 Tax=Smallanthus sonchifolius TaxID=185202 RepID=A0ACB9IQ78_9ASTR|nr:hypothetical protein L1987_19231 [Smallanthus sonchifolius]
MENNFHGLPPHKRFRLMHQDFTFPASSCLPAKKRKDTRDPPPIPTNLESTTTICLPAKKRICALHPNVDLNLEYDPKSETEEIDEDGVVCAVCQSTDGDPLDPIVFCDGCDLTVHTTCYGNPLTKGVPEGDWFCSQCEFDDKKKSLTCCLCGINGGAVKLTNDGRWTHIVCALFIPEVFFGDPVGREGIDCSKVVGRRWGGRCYVCKGSKGCVLDCSEEKCGLRFHVTCGLKEDLCIEYKEGRSRGAIVAGFCKTHTDLWMKQQATGKFKIVARNEE